MEAVNPRPAFVTILANIADNPQQEFSKFPSITTHEKKYSAKPMGIGAALVTFLFSAFVFKKSKPASVVLFSAGSVFLYKSIDKKEVPTKAYEEQAAAIDALFKPCIEGLEEAYAAKAQAIHSFINDTPMNSMGDVRSAIESFAKIYDGEAGIDLWNEKTVKKEMDSDWYRQLKTSAQTLTTYAAENLTTNPALINSIKKLQGAANKFLHGKQPDGDNQNVLYVQYGYANGTAHIFT